jgi:gag-polyprotein putative aspartyl protease
MPSLSGAFNPNIGPLISLFLTPPAVLRGGMQPSSAVPAQQATLNVHATMALIDTGASITSVTAALAQQVGLPLIGKRPIGTAGGIVGANIYLADIGIPFSAIPSGPVGQPLPPANVVAATVTNITVLEFQCPSPHFQMLLGRDILCKGVFNIGFDNRFTFSL